MCVLDILHLIFFYDVSLQQVSCGPGTFYNNQTKTCHFCPAGSYQPLEGQISCILCDSSSTTQYYGSYEASDCKEKCNPGHYFDTGTNKCQNCSRGFYQPDSGQFYCLACEADKTTKYQGTVLESSCANDCPPGQEIGPNNDCVVCTIGFFRGTDDALCQRCPAGNVTLYNESKSVVDCNVADNPPGTYRNTTNPSRYHPCPVDQYQPRQWQFECQPCRPGYRAESVGSTAESDCKFFCPAGQQVKNGEDSCEFCPFGTYRDGAKIFESCDNCPDAYTTPASGAKSRDDCSLYRCPAGSQPNSAQTGCDLCPQGQFQASANQASCDVCRAGFSTRQEGTIDPNACETYCPPGQEKKEGLCIDCQIGYFKNNNVDLFSNCTICTNNKYVTASIGATSNDNCTVLNCQEGFKANVTTLQCEPCPKGSYQDQKYQMSCIPCKGNKFTRYTNSTSESDCESYCPPGFEKTGGQCQACKRGFYKNNDLDRFMACTKCDNGFVTPEGSPATYSTNCTVPDCQPGTYISQGGCVECPSGTWQNVSWSESCNPCPQDKDTASGADSIDLCLLNCPEGKQNPAGTDVCESCPVGYYKDSPGTTSCEPCANLSQNNIRISAEPGADNLAKCNKLVCLPGYYPNGPVCSPCPYGSYQPEQWQDSCIPCPNGKTTYTQGATNNTECETSCPIGEGLYNGQCRICGMDEYNDGSDPTRRTCTSCPPGFITSRVGATSSAECNITDCPNPGTYRNSLTNSCANCPLGQYQNIPRQDACQLCQEGYTTKDVRSTSSDDCKRDCLPGQQLDEATGQCEPCPKGSYRSKALGQDSWTCQDCGNEMTTSGPGAVQVDDCNIATCSAGFGYDRTLAKCLECPANTYQDLDGQFLPCKSCPTNQITVRNATVSQLECSFPCSLGSTLCSITSQICVDDSSATGGYRCDCKDAYSRVQNTCTHKCNIPNYCGEKGVCQRSPFRCLCTEGYTGERCSIRPAASTQSSDKVETLVIAVVTTVCGLLFLLLLIVCICVVAKRRAVPASTSVTPDYEERGSMASHSVKGYDDYPTFAINPAFSSKPPSVFGTIMGQGMNGQGTKIYSNDIYTDEDSDPAVYKA
ncbi:signal peptide, cub and egf-like domain-containing protein 1 [Plakobranchus ocellatus]|uniref:Signal peptide, cub and egf-like domain-containing protein 1 n=1 Tax=Plakobranchus ocellatus TaxID=259542 RepID=A0AAV4CHF5_9GAST|nr:signal peptide, cub and egf-like domain-containing protein 1 [Plakobranchus ocellatus]